jgi:hypothetical protein
VKVSKSQKVVVAVVAVLVVVGFGVPAVTAQESPEQADEKVGVPSTYVRVAENDVGWVVVGYRMANESVKEKWMLLEVGITLKQDKNIELTRDQIKLVTPDKQVISLPTQEEFLKVSGSLGALNERAAMMNDSIDYFPPGTNQPCRIGFFASTQGATQNMMSYNEVDLSRQRACMGRLYFEVPDGIQYGNYNLDVDFGGSIVKVPMDIMTKEQAKQLDEQMKEERKKDKK